MDHTSVHGVMEKTSWLHTKYTLNNPPLPSPLLRGAWPLARVVELRLFWLPRDFRWHKSLAKGNCLKINSILLWRSNWYSHTHSYSYSDTHTYIYTYIACLVDCVCVMRFKLSPKLTDKICCCCGLFCVAKICSRHSHLPPLRLYTMGVWYSSPLSDASRL